MDWEHRIRELESDVKHLREMHDLRGERMDAHDRFIEAMRESAAHHAAEVAEIRGLLKDLSNLTVVIGQKLDTLMENIIRREDGNRS
jgi:hypothetical protein